MEINNEESTSTGSPNATMTREPGERRSSASPSTLFPRPGLVACPEIKGGIDESCGWYKARSYPWKSVPRACRRDVESLCEWIDRGHQAESGCRGKPSTRYTVLTKMLKAWDWDERLRSESSVPKNEKSVVAHDLTPVLRWWGKLRIMDRTPPRKLRVMVDKGILTVTKM